MLTGAENNSSIKYNRSYFSLSRLRNAMFFHLTLLNLFLHVFAVSKEEHLDLCRVFSAPVTVLWMTALRTKMR